MDWNAYHFVGEKLRDGSPVPANGVTLKHDGPIKMCASGFHASREAFDALTYAPGNTLCRVHCCGPFMDGNDKLVCTERTIVSRINAEKLLRDFARACALDVIHLWDAPDVVRDYLSTGREEIRDAAWNAAWAAAGTGAVDAAAAAAVDAAGDAAWDAAWATAQNAAKAAAVDAAAAWARAAAWVAAGARHGARPGAGAGAGAAAWAAVRASQRKRFKAMVDEAFGDGK